MTAPAIMAGPCEGGCGQIVSRERVPSVPGFPKTGELLNAVPLRCERCAAEHEQRLEREELERQERQAGIERRQRQGASGLPRELRHVDLRRLDHAGCARAIDLAGAWARLELRGLLLTGLFGSGKSTIAAGALWLLLAERPGRWVSAPSLLARLGAGLGSEQRTWALDLVSARHALVLDDLDKTRPTEYGAEQIFLAVDNAVTRGQQLLVTTNLSLGQLAEKWPAPFGEAIASRLVGHCTSVQVTGRDRRMGADS